MKQQTVPATLLEYVTGRLLGPSEATFKGLLWGSLAFAIFEMVSLINTNLPRVPVSWLLAVVIPTVETALFIRIAALLRRPRSEDFFFVMGLDRMQRKALAVSSFSSVQRIVLRFSLSMVAVAAVLEFLIMKERSPVNLAAVPLFTLGLTVLIGRIGVAVLDKGLVKPTVKDKLDSGRTAFLSETLGSAFRCTAHAISFGVGKIIPAHLRPLVIRNFLYLFRIDPFLFILFTIAVPLFLVFLFLLLGDRSSPFVSAFTLLGAFLLNVRHAVNLQEATVKLEECPYYSFSRGEIFSGQALTFLILSFIYLPVFAGIAWGSFFNLVGCLRMITFCLGLVVSTMICARSSIYASRKGRDQAFDWMLFGVIVLGFFIPIVGWIFPLLALLVLVLMEWEMVKSSG